MDSVYVRKCVLYILHSTLGRMLGEKTQFAACKELVAVVGRQVNVGEWLSEALTVLAGLVMTHGVGAKTTVELAISADQGVGVLNSCGIRMNCGDCGVLTYLHCS